MKLKTILLTLLLASSAMAQVPRSKHVVILTLENHSYEQVIGNPLMPYFNQLASTYGLATQYYATSHNSITALMWLTAGAPVTGDDNTLLSFDVDNIVRHMLPAGVTWKSYASALPYVGYTGFNVGTYVKRHNPLAYFTDVANGSQKMNLVPYAPNFRQDVANGTLPEYSYVTPDVMEDAHDGTLAQADYWLKQNVPALLASPQFQQDGVLFIVWDEGNIGPIDWRNGGGRVATLVIGPKVKAEYKSTTFYNTQSVLRSSCDALGLASCPGGGATGTAMSEFFTPRTVQIEAPVQTYGTPAVGTNVPLVAHAFDFVYPVTGMVAYVDNQEVARTASRNLNTTMTLAPGFHTLVVRAWDSNGAWFDTTRQMNVTSCGAAATGAGISLCTITSATAGTGHVLAHTTAGTHPIAATLVYVDNVERYRTYTDTADAWLSVAAGSHTVTVRAWDTSGTMYTATRSYTQQ